MEINVPPSASIQIIDDQNNITGYNNGNVLSGISGSLPRFIKNGSEDPPYGYHLQNGNYSVVLRNFADSFSNTSFSTGNKSMMYERYDADQTQTDRLFYDGSISVTNPDLFTKSISLVGIVDEYFF